MVQHIVKLTVAEVTLILNTIYTYKKIYTTNIIRVQFFFYFREIKEFLPMPSNIIFEEKTYRTVL